MPVFSSYLSYQSENTFDSKMKTSGSVIGRAKHLPTALFKGYEGSDLMISTYGPYLFLLRILKSEMQLK